MVGMEEINAYGVIYCIKDNTNDKCYYGQHIGTDVETRWKAHQSRNGCLRVSNAIQKRGKDKFTFSVVTYCSGGQWLLDALEIYYIKSRNSLSPNGYNLTAGGRYGGIPSEETRAKLSKAGKGRPKSAEHRAKIGNAHKGRHVGEETREKLRIYNTGLKRSEESIRKNVAFTQKKVVQLSKDGVFIKFWDCISEAQRTLNISTDIGQVCNGKRKSAGGFVWKHFSDYSPTP